MISAKEIVNKCVETKREDVKQIIIDAVQNEFEGKAGETVELSTSAIPDGECTVFIGWSRNWA